jgi:hypothetical protein
MPLPNVQLEIDLNARNGTIRPLHGVNLGPIQMNGWADASALFKEMAIPHTRLHDCPYAVPETVDVHSIFPIFDADPRDPKNYRFAITDDYIQAILDTGSQIIYRLGETIEHYTRNKYFVHPPRDFEKWAEICVNIIRHYNEGWAKGFHHNIRYWEIWNEPWLQPNCWTGKDEDYFRLYEVAAKAIKRHNPKLLVGGPSSAGSGPRDFGERLLKHCRRTGAPLDFYTWHCYALDPVPIVEQSVEIREMLVRNGFAKAECHLNEWNYLPAEAWLFNSPKKNPDCIRRAVEEISGIQGAVFTAATLALMQDGPLDVANYYWARGDYWGLLDSYGAPRKNYYAFKAFRSMLDTPQRAKTTVNHALKGYALLAGTSPVPSLARRGADLASREPPPYPSLSRRGARLPRAGVMLANCRARETDFALTIKRWPWKGKAVCKRYLLDYDRNLNLVGEDRLEGRTNTVNLCMPAPALCYLAVTPER